MQAATSGEAGATSGIEHGLGAELHGVQALFSSAVQHAGVGQIRHDRQQRIEPGVLFAMAGGAAAFELRQRALQHRREAQLRFLTGSASAVALSDLNAVAEWTRRVTVVEQRKTRRTNRYAACSRGFRVQRSGSDQQSQGPDRPAMSIHAARGVEHRLLAFATDAADGFAQGQADLTERCRNIGHRLEGRPQGQRRSVHQPQVQIAVGAIAAAVDQCRFRRQISLVDQRVNRQVRQPLGQAQGFGLQVECVHYQLLNLAGGL